MITLINNVNFAILLFFIFSIIIYTLILIGSFSAILEYFRKYRIANIVRLLDSTELPPVTIMTPIYNESNNIIDCTKSLINSEYKNLYIMLINDGSTDDTLEKLVAEFNFQPEPIVINEKLQTAEIKSFYVSRKHPHLILIDKVNSGTGDSLNVGLNACFTPYYITVDADSIIDKHAVSGLMFEVLTNPDAIACGGGVYILNACTTENGVLTESKMPYKLVPALQCNEYIRSHLFNRTGWNSYGGTMSYSGTASLINRSLAIKVQGYDKNNFAQDTEIIMRLHHYMRKQKIKYQIRFNPSVAVWTDVPNTLARFGLQRDRWQRGMLKSTLRYLSMFFNPRYKIQGLFSYPMYVLLEIFAPFVEFAAYISLSVAYYLGILNGTSAILYVILAWGFTSYITICNMFVNLITFNRYKKLNDILWMFFLAFIEMFGFRQYHVLIRIYGSIHYLVNRLIGKPI